MGVAGFLVDAITHLKKDLDWASLPADGIDELVSVAKKGQNRQGINVADEQQDDLFVLHYYQKLGRIRHNDIWEKLSVSGNNGGF